MNRRATETAIASRLALVFLLVFPCLLAAADGWPWQPLPINEVSQYFETLSSGIDWDTETRCGRFTLTLKPAATAPRTFWLEAHFPDPAKDGREKVVSARGSNRDSSVVLESPRFRGFECGNYRIFVHIYAAHDRATPLGTHYQFIQSTVDLSKVKSREQLVSAILRGNCRD